MKWFQKKKDDWWEARDAYQAEEDAQQEKRHGLLAIAFLCCGLCIYLLYHMERVIYGGVIETNWMTWLGTMIGFSIVRLVQSVFGKSEKQPAKDDWDKGEKIAGYVILAAVVVVILWFVSSRKRLWILSGQFLVLLLPAFLLSRMEKAGAGKSMMQVWDYLLTAALIALVTFAMPKAMGIVTVKQAETTILAEGCTDVEYLDRAFARWVFPEEKESYWDKPILDDKQYYVFSAEKDSEPWGFVIDPEGGGIVLAGATADDPHLAEMCRSAAIE